MTLPSADSPHQSDLFREDSILFYGKAGTPLLYVSDLNNKGKTNHMPKFKQFHKFQKPLVGLSPESFLDHVETVIPEEHLCRFVKQVVYSLDTESIEAKYSFLGQNSYHPKLMLSLLFYGYAIGIRSSRKLAERCMGDHFFIFLMQYYTPDYRTISDFRKNNIKEIGRYFVEIIRIFKNLGFSKVGKIYVDGTKIKARASSKRTKDQAGFEKWLDRIDEEITQLLKEAEAVDFKEDESAKAGEEQEVLMKKLSKKNHLKSKITEALKIIKEENLKKVNLTDSDAVHMKKGGSKDVRPSYNCQTVVTEEGIITAAEAVKDPNDMNQLEPMIENTENNTGTAINEVTADSGYGTYSTYEYLERKKIDGYVPDRYFSKHKSGEYEKEENRYHYSNFKYDSSTDSYTCPEGKRLILWKIRDQKTKARDWRHKVYKGTQCGDCQSKSLCTKAKKRELLIDMREPLLQEMRKKLLSQEGQNKYFKRQYTIEPVFGHLKFNLGYKNFLLRGIEKVNAEFKLMAIGWNLKKMLKLGLKPALVG